MRLGTCATGTLASAPADAFHAPAVTRAERRAGTTPIDDMEVADGPLVLVVGSEGRGLSRLVGERCDLLARIPMAADTESLNAGVAAGVALYAVGQARAGQRAT